MLPGRAKKSDPGTAWRESWQSEEISGSAKPGAIPEVWRRCRKRIGSVVALLIRERGGNPFMDYQVPEAVIKLKQGFGRLIRTRTDTGMVAILDPRVRTKRYGQLFLDSLPECEVVIDS